MSELLIPPWIIPEEEQQEPLDEGSSVFGAAFAPGIAQRQSYGGMRLKLSRRHTVRLEEKAQLLAALRSTRGRYNLLRSKVHFALRGSFPAIELLSNNTFANGTTGWTGASGAVLSVADRILRVTRSDSTQNYQSRQAVTMVQYAPYVARTLMRAGLGQSSLTAYLDDTTRSSMSSVGEGFKVATIPGALTTAGLFAAEETTSSGGMAGDYFTVPYASVSRCALVDNGLNSLLYSDQIDNATGWTTLTNATITANGAGAPDGTATLESLNENTTLGLHDVRSANVAVASSASDYTFSVALKAANRSWAEIAVIENTGSTACFAFFNLANGAVGTTGVGANWSSIRTAVVGLGNSWYACTITARKTNAATSLRVLIGAANANGGDNYAGIGTQAAIYIWRATHSQSSVPTRLVQTTSAASSGTSQTGSALYVKGLPASTNGLLLHEDIFEINGELKTCTAALNSDAAGLGYLQFEPSLVRSPADNDPVIILDPMGKFLMSNLKIDNEFGTQAIVSYDLEHIYE